MNERCEADNDKQKRAFERVQKPPRVRRAENVGYRERRADDEPNLHKNACRHAHETSTTLRARLAQKYARNSEANRNCEADRKARNRIQFDAADLQLDDSFHCVRLPTHEIGESGGGRRKRAARKRDHEAAFSADTIGKRAQRERADHAADEKYGNNRAPCSLQKRDARWRRATAAANLERRASRRPSEATCKRVLKEEEQRLLRGICDRDMIAEMKRAAAADEKRRREKSAARPLIDNHRAYARARSFVALLVASSL